MSVWWFGCEKAMHHFCDLLRWAPCEALWKYQIISLWDLSQREPLTLIFDILQCCQQEQPRRSHCYISALALTCRKCLIGAEQTPTHPHTSPQPWAPAQAAPPPRCGCGMVSLHEWQPASPAQQWLQQSDIEPVSLSLSLTPPPPPASITAALQSHQLANIILSSGWC